MKAASRKPVSRPKGTLALQGGEEVSEWDVSLAWYLRPLEAWVKRHFMKGAQHALDRIVEAARASAGAGPGPSKALN